ncbi:hypothetical protein EV363DRAFT_1354597 [Boletus edulis]|nr:hypothetical protein EV363DRAFT_1354597 [Boletus edulis]
MATHACFLFLMLSSIGRAQLRGIDSNSNRLGRNLDSTSVWAINGVTVKCRVHDAAANGDQNTLCERLIHGRV